MKKLSIFQYLIFNLQIVKSSNLQYVNNLYGWELSQKLPVNNFEWIKDTSQFNKKFIKNYNEESDEVYFLNLMFNILKDCMDMMINHFYLKKMKIEKSLKAYS